MQRAARRRPRNARPHRRPSPTHPDPTHPNLPPLPPPPPPLRAAGVNDNPTLVASGPSTSTPEDTPVTLNTTELVDNVASDVDAGDSLKVGAIETPPANGNATLNADGTITYTPNANFAGNDTFTYTVVDSNNGSVVVTATVTISALPAGWGVIEPWHAAAQAAADARGEGGGG